MTLQQILEQKEVSQADFARGANLSKASANRLVKSGVWPARTEKKDRENVKHFLMSLGVKPAQLKFLNNATSTNKKTPAAATNGAEVISTNQSKELITVKDIDMLLNFQAIDQSTLQHFNLMRDPFRDDIQTLDDVFKSAQTRYASVQLEDAARCHSFVAIVAESGAGKTTLVEALEEKIKNDSDIVVIKPYVLAMEHNDIKGKTLKSSQLVDSIASALDPDIKLKRSPDARFKQMHNMLKDSCRAGRKHLLLVEEAHCMPIPTLKHLKRFNELKNGLQRLLGIALIAQPELAIRLSNQNPEIREVAQRCEIIHLPPLDNDLKPYLQHKLDRAGAKFEDVFADDAVDAIRARLISRPRGAGVKDIISMCYPLVVNNLVSRAMNAAARTCEDKVTAQAIAGC